jgi:hypothetical protein
MKVKYPNSLMLKTDTDSLLYLIETDDLYQDFKNDKNKQKTIEFSNYPKEHPLYNCDRKKIPGLFQDECVDGKFLVISEYVGLRAKSYSNKLYNTENNDFEEKKKSKGVSNKHLKKRIDFNDYKTCLFDETIITLGKDNNDGKYKDKIYSFVSHKLATYSVESGKIALSGKDDKRILMKDKIHTYAIGHYKTKN